MDRDICTYVQTFKYFKDWHGFNIWNFFLRKMQSHNCECSFTKELYLCKMEQQEISFMISGWACNKVLHMNKLCVFHASTSTEEQEIRSNFQNCVVPTGVKQVYIFAHSWHHFSLSRHHFQCRSSKRKKWRFRYGEKKKKNKSEEFFTM